MKKKGECVFCHGVVKSGGDRHAGAGYSAPLSRCNVRGPFWERRRKAKKKPVESEVRQRGVAVANVGGGKAKTHRTKTKIA